MNKSPSMSPITEIKVEGAAIDKIAMSLEPFLWDVPRTHAIMALLSLAASLMYPKLELQDIQACVRGMSEWMCLYFAGREEEKEGQEVEVMN